MTARAGGDASAGEVSAGAVTVVRVEDREQLEQAWAVRTEVFVAEQGVPVEEEVDELDTAPTTTHVLALDAAGRAVGTGRLLNDPEHPGEVHLGRLAVRAAERGRGTGARLVVAIEALALAQHGAGVAEGPLQVRVVLSAQEYALAFYRRLGYEVVSGERYLDAGIWHQEMARTVTA
ncbi:GNAT family N-acetyltransferase [Georgenia halophila]|uniref:GNAT family N-acetyltransferase n=1 Tax=Georgenia halophila TaxID=620889 RepID=A0ABP8L6N0_9MICO